MVRSIVLGDKIDNLNDKADGIKGDTSIKREKVTIYRGQN
jgi:hypothetical protein